MNNERMLNRLANPTFMAFAVTVIAWTAAAMLIRGFNTFNYNVQFVQNSAYLGIIVIGQAMAIISGGIDLSVSSVVTLSSVIASACVQRGMGSIAAIALALLASLAVGVFNAAGINMLSIPPIIMSIATMSILEGILLIATNGTPPSGVSEFILNASNGKLIPMIPNVILIYAFLAAFALWFMMKSRWGRQIYAIGSSETVSWLSGVEIGRVKCLVYCASSLFAGMAGILYLGYMGSTYLTIGVPFQLFSIAAVVIGGISVLGGKGNFAGIIAGTFLIGIVRDVLVVVKISAAGRELFQGLLILIIILAYGREKLNK